MSMLSAEAQTDVRGMVEAAELYLVDDADDEWSRGYGEGVRDVLAYLAGDADPSVDLDRLLNGGPGT